MLTRVTRCSFSLTKGSAKEERQACNSRRLAAISIFLLPNAWTFGKWSPEEWNGIVLHDDYWARFFAKTSPTPTILNYVTSTVTFLMAADVSGRAWPYTLRIYLGSANPS